MGAGEVSKSLDEKMEKLKAGLSGALKLEE